MNVLKNFLLSDAPSERSKLAVVLCSILHIRPEETRLIEEKWAVKRPSGLAGWFMGSQRAASSSDTDVNVEQNPKESIPSDE